VASAQTLTLRERVARAHADVSINVNVDGSRVNFNRLIKETDLIVQAEIGDSTSLLSPDGKDIYTQYQLLSPRVLYSSPVDASAQPGVPPPLVVTQSGGEVKIDGFTAKVLYDNTVILKPGTDVVLLLHRDNRTYRLAASVGAFEVWNSTIVPLAKSRGDHQKFDGMSVESFVQDVLARRNGSDPR